MVIDSYSTSGTRLSVITTSFNKSDRLVTVHAAIEAFTSVETRMGTQITSTSRKEIVLPINPNSQRKDQIDLPAPQGKGSTVVQVFVLRAEVH